MKLTEQEKKTLLSVGYLLEDLPKIEQGITGVKVYEITDGDEITTTTQRAFSRLFGRETLILRSARAIFHGSATYGNGDSLFILEG